MKRICLILCLLGLSVTINAQAKYGSMDYTVKINVSKEVDSTFLTFSFMSRTLKMSDPPKLLLRLMDDTVISLDGSLLSTSNTTTGSVMVGNTALPVNYIVTEAKFPIAKEQIEQFKKGIKKLRLNTSPKYHEKEWRKDKIGMKLFESYKECRAKSFEDGF